MLAKLHKKITDSIHNWKRERGREGGNAGGRGGGGGFDGKPARTDGQSRQFGQQRSRGRKTPYSAHHSQITFPPLT